ncbi:peptidylprolyl isomerase [Helicobacter sp. 23-1044]
MISWMQKHKKYLIVTIWISTIAFIAAGMVGWGAYSFGGSSSAVAKVGSIKITANDLNLEYNNILRNYEQNSGMTLDAEQAKALGIEDLAMQMLINKALLENFALDSAIRISDDEVFDEISKIESFKENGAFNTNLYKEILRQNRLKPLDFEEKTRRDLLIQKILALFPSILTPLEKEILDLVNLQDRLSVQIIPASAVRVNISDDDLQKYFNENKEKYKSDKRFEVEILRYEIDAVEAEDSAIKKYYDDNLQNYTKDGAREDFGAIKERVAEDFKEWRAKRSALEAIIALRDGKQKGEILQITQNSHPALVSAIEKAKGRVEPILDGGAYYAIKVLKEIPQENLSFEIAKKQVRSDFYPTALKNALIKEAQARQNIFAGRDIGFYSLGANKSILSLNIAESAHALQEIFSKSDKSGFVIFSDKVLLYNILEQKMLDSTQNLPFYNDFKSRILEQSIFEFLSRKYKIVDYTKQRG